MSTGIRDPLLWYFIAAACCGVLIGIGTGIALDARHEFCIYSPVEVPQTFTGDAVLLAGSHGPTIVYRCDDGIPDDYKTLADEMDRQKRRREDERTQALLESMRKRLERMEP